jgi:hypothetical protein
MRQRERGVTFLGWLFILIPMGLVLYAGIRLAPLYLEYMKIARTLEQVGKDFKGDQADAQQIRTAIERHFDIEDVHVLTVRDTDKLKLRKEDSGYVMEVSYVDIAPYIGQISLQVAFNKVVRIE